MVMMNPIRMCVIHNKKGKSQKKRLKYNNDGCKWLLPQWISIGFQEGGYLVAGESEICMYNILQYQVVS